MALDAVIFDLDGTLIDSNSLHAEAWRLVFDAKGYHVSLDRIFVEIGKGGDHLVPDLLGRDAAEHDGPALRDAQPKRFATLLKDRGVRVFPRTRELIAAVRARGLKTALSTSGAPTALKATAKAADLDLDDLFDQIVTSEDISQSKPSKDAVTTAAEKLGVSPAQTVMIGDTPYDAESAKRAGSICLALRSGDFLPRSLRAAGARAIYLDPAGLLDHLDEALALASPGTLHMDRATQERLMDEALAAAQDALAKGEAPIGAALFTGDGRLLARGYNQLNKTQNKTAHAEIVTFAAAAGRVDPQRRDLILASTLEPCVMCLGAAMEAAVDTVLFGLPAPADGGLARVQPPQSPESQMPRLVGQIKAEASLELLQQWLSANDPASPQGQYVQQLLKLNAD